MNHKFEEVANISVNFFDIGRAIQKPKNKYKLFLYIQANIGDIVQNVFMRKFIEIKKFFCTVTLRIISLNIV